MRSALLIILVVLCSIFVVAQGADANLRSDLEALHAKWFNRIDMGEDDGESRPAAEARPADRARVEWCVDPAIRGYGHPHWQSRHQVRQRNLTGGDDGGVRKEFWEVEDSLRAMEPSHGS
jgi:hypothetical protein